MIVVPYRKFFVTALLGAALVGCSNEADPNSPEGKRQAVFKQMLKQSEPMGGMLSDRLPFDGNIFAEHAKKLAQLVDQPWSHFPEPGEDPETNRAKADIWSDPQGFAQAIDTYKTAVVDLTDATQGGVSGPAQVSDQLRAVQQACKACHDTYRR